MKGLQLDPRCNNKLHISSFNIVLTVLVVVPDVVVEPAVVVWESNTCTYSLKT